MISTFGSVWGLTMKLFFSLKQMRLESGIVIFCRIFSSPLPARLCKEEHGFDDRYARSNLRYIGVSIICQNRKGLAGLQLGEEFLDGGRGLPDFFDHF